MATRSADALVEDIIQFLPDRPAAAKDVHSGRVKFINAAPIVSLHNGRVDEDDRRLERALQRFLQGSPE